MTTRKPESAASQDKRLSDAIQAKEAAIVKDGLDATVKGDTKVAKGK